ncbi:MAG: hypothetical protein J6W89_03970 [Paludibacteraceae bacterium]|nr:hypothetical protein [Paludibacteraceae bacterium]
MKRFTSILCALVIALSAIAAPGLKIGKVTEAQLQKTLKQDAKAKNAFEQNAFKKFAPAAKPAKAPKAKAATTNVAVSKVSSKFYAEDNDIYYSLYNEDQSKIFCFDIVCATGEEDVKSGVTYTLEGMIEDYCEWVNSDDVYNGTAFTAASFKKTVANDGSYTIEASATDANGDIWNLSYSGEAFVPQVYNLTMATANLSYYQSSSDMYITMSDADENYIFYFDILLPDGQKTLTSGQTYTLADMDADYSYGEDYVEYDYVYYASASFTQTVAADGSYTIAVVIVDKKGNTWNLSYTYTKPTEATNVKIGTVQKDYYSSYNLIMYQLLSEDNTQMFVFPIYLESGQEDVVLNQIYTLSDMMSSYAYRATNAGSKNYTEASFTKSLYDEGLVKIVADVVTADGAFHVVYEEPKTIGPTGETINVVINEPFDMTYYSESKDWYITAENNDYKVVIDFFCTNSESPVGSYSSANQDFDLTYTYLKTKGEESSKINAVEATATVALDNNILKLEALILGQNGIVYAIKATRDESILPGDETAEDFEEDFAEYTLDDQYFDDYDGELDVNATNDNNAGLSLAFYGATKALAAGEYPVASTGAVGTMLASEGISGGYLTPSFVGYKSAQGYTQFWFIVAGKATVDAKGNIEVNATNSAGRTIKCKLAAKEPTAVENVNAAQKAVKFIENGQLIIRKNGKNFNAQGVEVR